MCVCMCVYVCMCAVWKYVCVCCLSDSSVSVRLWWKQQTKMVLWFTSSIIKDGSSAPWEPIEAIHWPIINVNWPQSPRPWHMTQANRQHFPIIQFTSLFWLLFMSLGLALSQSGHSQPNTCSLSSPFSILPSLNSLLWWQSHRHWVERWWERARREEEDIPIGNIIRRGWVRTLSHWPFSLSCLCLTPPQLCLSSNTKDCEELIGSKELTLDTFI